LKVIITIMQLYQSNILRTINGLSHGFFAPGSTGNRNHNLSFKNAAQEEVIKARQLACGLLNIDHQHLTHVYQEHGTVIWDIKTSHRGAGALTGENQVGHGDAMITSDIHTPLAILVADCLPVFFSLFDSSVVGLAHAGWRGTYDDISVKMIDKLTGDYGAALDDIRIWIGPGISPKGFKVKNDVWQPFFERWGQYTDCFDSKNHSIDLKLVNKYRLEEHGVSADNIEVSPDCTYSDNRFFSYRRDGAGIGHNMAVIMREQTN
jgi:purine-nucleoside/S-methyl-5'-thioadenosine phosphorylase / adenosine deaminase